MGNCWFVLWWLWVWEIEGGKGEEKKETEFRYKEEFLWIGIGRRNVGWRREKRTYKIVKSTTCEWKS